MSHIPSPSAEAVLHLESEHKPFAHNEFRDMITRSAEAYNKSGYDYATYETIIGNGNVVHRFAKIEDFLRIGGRDVQNEVICTTHGEDDLQSHVETGQEIVIREQFNLLSYVPAISNPGDDTDPDLLLMMTTQVNPGRLHTALGLMERTASAFKKNHSAKFSGAVQTVGNIGVVRRFSPLGGLHEIGGLEVLKTVLDSEFDTQAINDHFETYGASIASEEFSVLRRVK